MAIFKDIWFSCKEATLLTLKEREEGLPVASKFRLMVHLSYCKCCKLFVKQTKLMDQAAKKYKENLFQHPPHKLSQEARDSIQKQLEGGK